MRHRCVFGALAALFCSLPMSSAMASDGWQKIHAPDEPYYSDGNMRTPSCSAGPKLVDTPFGPIPVDADTAYAFFIRHGDPNKLAIVFDGGGACWDANTCVGTAIAGESVYSLEADETAAELSALPGIGDSSNPENPIAGYTQVFIPYCTADLHTGDNTEIYALTLPDGSVLPWDINHRGADNVDFVLDWVQGYYAKEVGRAPREVFVTGLSAGGYGALYHLPDIASRVPWYTKIRVLVDAANGVITQDFQDRALSQNGVWGLWENLSPLLKGAFSSGPDELAIEIFKSLGSAYPRARFGQYTTAFDLTQIGFYNLARNTDSPELWLDPAELAVATFEWTLKARTFQILTAFQVWNYRFYLGKGEDHTVLADDKFYSEDSARGVRLVDWVDDLINRRWSFGGDWRNVSCTPNCLP